MNPDNRINALIDTCALEIGLLRANIYRTDPQHEIDATRRRLQASDETANHHAALQRMFPSTTQAMQHLTEALDVYDDDTLKKSQG